MCHDKISIAAAVLVCLTLMTLVPSFAVCQTDPNKPQQSESSKPEEKKAEAKKIEAKKIEVHVKVSTKDGKPLPAKTIVEISGREKACGSLNSNDATEAIDENGEATFSLPVCKVTVKVNVALYIPAIKPVDLADYKSPIELFLEREH